MGKKDDFGWAIALSLVLISLGFGAVCVALAYRAIVGF